MPSIEDKIKIIPVEQPFLRVLAEHVKEKFASGEPDFSRILMVFPSQRNKFYFRRYLLEAVHSAGIIPPAMKTVDELLSYAYERSGGKRGRLLNSLERNFILKSVVDSQKVEMWHELPFLRFISMGDRLLNFFDELARERVTIKDLQDVSALGHYPEKYREDELPILETIYNDYRDAISSAGVSDNIDMNGVVFDQFSIDALSEFDFVIIGGLAALTAVETKMVKTILLDLPSELVLHSCAPGDLEKADNIHSPFYVHHKLFRNLGAQPQQVSALGKHNPAHPVVHVRVLKNESQQTFDLQSILQEVAKRYNELHRIGIVIADESILFSVTESLKALGLEYNLSAGLPFRQSSLYSFIGQLHEFIKSDYHYQEFFSFIRHPLVKNAAVDGQPLRPLIYGLETAMVAGRYNYYEADDFADKFEPLSGFVKRCCRVANAETEFSGYLDGISALLNDLLSYNQEIIKRSSPDIMEFLDRLHELSALRVPKKHLPKGNAMLEFLLRVLEEGRYHVQGDPMRGVQVIGLLEARNLDFDCLILPSMNEGVFPKHSEKDMFVNQAVRREARLPYSQERENLYYYYFTELNAGKKEVHISYVAEEDRDIASRFITLAFPGMRHDNAVTKLKHSAVTLPKREVKKSDELLKIIYGKLQQRGLSPTALSDYRACPYGYYLKYILGIAEPEEIVEEPGALEWGGIIHSALQYFYSKHFPRGFKQNEMAKAVTILEQEFDKAIAYNRRLARKPRAVAYLDAEIYKRRLRNFLVTEQERFSQGFEIFKASLERKEKHHIQVNSMQVRLTGVPDRIDILDKKYYIIDYKTGKLPARKEYEIGEDFNAYQLPMYALIFSKDHSNIIGGMLYYSIDEESQTRDIVEGKDVENYLNDFRQEILIPTIKEIIDPNLAFSQTEDSASCKYCIYNHVCGDIDGQRD
ncbi:MAG: PD-(D/E)XK nuclease family protein [candidate division WOR-3 bacterium]|nr:MAG: PD-(D/E)XK nuclease family protein [candidate division WOR-3 bacterium]